MRNAINVAVAVLLVAGTQVHAQQRQVEQVPYCGYGHEAGRPLMIQVASGPLVASPPTDGISTAEPAVDTEAGVTLAEDAPRRIDRNHVTPQSRNHNRATDGNHNRPTDSNYNRATNGNYNRANAGTSSVGPGTNTVGPGTNTVGPGSMAPANNGGNAMRPSAGNAVAPNGNDVRPQRVTESAPPATQPATTPTMP